jgi:hypothetical protein
MSNLNVTLTEEESDLVNQCAATLRLIQSDSSAIESGKRHEYLREEISRNLKDVPTTSRERLLKGLLSRFPVGGQVVFTAPAAAPQAEVARREETLDELFQRFLALAVDLPEQPRTEFAKKLYDAGLGWVDREALELEISGQLRERLGIQAGRQPQLNRVVELASLLVQTFYEMDRAALLTLKELYPKSSLLHRSKDFRFLAGQYLGGENAEIEPYIRVVSSLIGGMLAAMLGGGRDFGRQFIEKYSPAAIEEVIIVEGRSGFMGPGKKERCWDKFDNLSKDIATPELIDRWFKDCLGKFVDSRTKNG